MLEVIHHLKTKFVLYSTTFIFIVFLDRLLSHCAFFTSPRVHMPKSCEFNPVTDRVPFEVKHGVHGLDFDPPASLLKGIPYESRVVTVPDYELVAVFDVGVFEGNLAHGPLEDMCIFAT